MTSRILGIDPGLSGALALYDINTGKVETKPFPTLSAGTKSKRVIDEVALARIIDNVSEHIKFAVIEKVHAMPGQGVTSMFNFGVTYGIIKGIISANFIPVEYVTPQVWKKTLRVPAAKEGSRLRATELFPEYSVQWNLAKWDGRAEAAMIAFYGAKHITR